MRLLSLALLVMLHLSKYECSSAIGMLQVGVTGSDVTWITTAVRQPQRYLPNHALKCNHGCGVQVYQN